MNMSPFTRILNGFLSEYMNWELRQQIREIMREPLTPPADPKEILLRVELDQEIIRIWSTPGYIDVDAMISYDKRKAG